MRASCRFLCPLQQSGAAFLLVPLPRLAPFVAGLGETRRRDEFSRAVLRARRTGTRRIQRRLSRDGERNGMREARSLYNNGSALRAVRYELRANWLADGSLVRGNYLQLPNQPGIF